MVSDVLAGKCDAVTNSLTQGLDNTTLDRGEVNEALTENDLFEGVIDNIEDAKDPVKSPFLITGAKLKLIFSDTDQARCDEIASIINRYSAKFKISTVLRMAHFLGQIGTETGGLLYLEENQNYSPRRIVELYGVIKYADLFEGYDSDPNTCIGVKYESDGGTLGAGSPSPVTPVFPYANAQGIINDYAFPIIGVTTANIKQKVASTYNAGKLKVKEKYIGADSKLFDVTYACRMGNRGPGSGDGSTFAGKGFIHLTGRWEYKQISLKWNADPENVENKMEFHRKDIGLLTSDLDVAMKASMYYWVRRGLNSKADKGISSASINKVGEAINGKNPPEAAEQRQSNTENAYKILSK